MDNMFKVHLNNHTDIGSPKQSAATVKKSVKYAKSLGYKAYAITDYSRIDGWVLFNMACRDTGIKGIYGVEAFEAHRTVEDKTYGKDDIVFNSIFLAKNMMGIKFIRKLVTFSLKLSNKFDDTPRYDIPYLLANKDMIKGNIIFLTAGINGRLVKLLENEQEDKAKEYMDTMVEIFGKENIFVELQDHDLIEEKRSMMLLLNFAEKYKFQIVATNDVHYVEKKDYIAREICLAREAGQTMAEREENNEIWPSEYYIKSPEEMDKLFAHIPEALENTGKIIDMCEDIDLEEKKYHYPIFPIPEGHTPESYMEAVVWEKLPKKYPVNTLSEDKRKIIEDRVKFEIKTIQDMNVSAYMLIDADFIVWAKENKIKVGPGRGSACGSIVANVMGITNVDPLPFNLLMERFLNPERVSMPDIDTDYMDSRRLEVVNYVVNKYGRDKVAQIITYGTMGARVAIRDVGAVFGVDAKLVDKVAKMIPMQPGITIDLALGTNPELKALYDTDNTVHQIIEYSKLVEGLVRQTGVHAAGVLISDLPLEEYGSLMEIEGSDIPVFCGDMKAVEWLRLLKMDFLGLRTLTVINDGVELIQKDTGIFIDIDNITFDDPEVFKFISTGKTHGVFQLEQGGMQQFMRDLQPETLEDIIAGISMYRPGPMESIPTFLKGKENPEGLEYPPDAEHLLRPILDVTYSVMVYQEQVSATRFAEMKDISELIRYN